MTNVGNLTNWRFTLTIPKGYAPGTYTLPIVARDVSGNICRDSMSFTIVGPVPKIIKIVYDGETTPTDANWTSSWGTNSGIDVAGTGMFSSVGLKVSMQPYSGGYQMPESTWASGVDVSGFVEPQQ